MEESESPSPKDGEVVERLDLEVDSVALQRLLDEVRHDEESVFSRFESYNRTYHRHNR